MKLPKTKFILLALLLQFCQNVPTETKYQNVFDPIGNFDNNPPSLGLTITPDTGIVDQAFTFDASECYETEAPDAKLSFRWDFDNDGSWDTDWTREKVVNYNYMSSYRYFNEHKGNKAIKVNLLVRGAKNFEQVISDSVYVNSYPASDIKYSFDILDPELIHFDASKSYDYEDGNALFFRWDFDNDGTWDTGWTQNPQISNRFSGQNFWKLKCQIKDKLDLVTTHEMEDSVFNNNKLVAYYDFNNNVNDLSENGNHGTIYGSTFTEDMYGNDNSALYFDGMDDYVDLGNSVSLKPDKEITVILNINFKSFGYTNISGIFSNNNPNNGKYGYNIYIDNLAKISFRTGTGSKLFSSPTYRLKENEWYTIIATAKIVNNKIIISSFFNGRIFGWIENNFNALDIKYNASNVTIGNINNNFFNGTIASLIIFNRILSIEEQHRIYKGVFRGL